MSINHNLLIKKYQAILEAEASEKTKLWWEKYMKGVIPFRGVGIPKNRELLSSWRKDNGIDKWSAANQLDLALAFFIEPIAEDKLTAILFLQNFLYDKLPWRTLLGRFEEIYAKKLMFDWNICDWFCIRVLGPMIKENGIECAKAITSWKGEEYLWKARSSVVPFVNLASNTQYYPYIHEACMVLVRREERFSKTAVGWVLRDISKYDDKFVTSFIDENLEYFSRESMSNALKYFDENKRKEYLHTLNKPNPSLKPTR